MKKLFYLFLLIHFASFSQQESDIEKLLLKKLPNVLGNMADQTPFGAGIRSLIGNKKSQLENTIVNLWIKYSKAFEYKDYEMLSNYFSFPVVFDALNEPEKIINKMQLIEKYKIIREVNIQEDYKYSILNKYNFIQLSDDFVILDAHYSRYNSKYKKIFFGRGLYSYKRVNTKWKLFEINSF
ncbi:MAG: hypothetical protein CMC48_09540 [Flavobacteriaceae bacterium]|nr:hypothetical protein [Flavobacteriaceae bacterium]